MTSDELLFVPLGGAGEIGMNMSLYGYQDRWLMIDMGISFGDETTLQLTDPIFTDKNNQNTALFFGLSGGFNVASTTAPI